MAEYALALTLSGLRRIPQLHQAMQSDLRVWDYSPGGGDRPFAHRGAQFGDDDRFTSGTIAGKRVRVIGAGNIGSRYASFCASSVRMCRSTIRTPRNRHSIGQGHGANGIWTAWCPMPRSLPLWFR